MKYLAKDHISVVNHSEVAAQQALAADGASRPRDHGYFESYNRPEYLPDLECAAAEAQHVGRAPSSLVPLEILTGCVTLGSGIQGGPIVGCSGSMCAVSVLYAIAHDYDA